jgi:MFS family permease
MSVLVSRVEEKDKVQEASIKENISVSPFNKSDGYRTLLKNKDFLSLWLGQIFSQLGDRVIFVVFVAVIASSFGTSTTLQSYLYVAFTIPAMLLTIIAGVFIDRWNKKYTLITTNILRAVLIMLLPLFNNTLFGIYALAFLVSSVTQFFIPTEASSIPTLVKKNQLLAANSLFTTTMMGSLIFGFILGDPLINIFGLKSVHWGISALFIASACFLSFIKRKPMEPECTVKKTFKDFINELKLGISYIKNTPVIFQAMLKLATLFSVIVMLSILAISISQEKLYPGNPALGAQKFAYIVAFSGIGMVLGSFIVGKFGRSINKYSLIFWGFTIMGINLMLLAGVGLIPNHLHINFAEHEVGQIYFAAFKLTYRMIFTYIMAAVIGFGGALIAIPVQTIIHSHVPEDMRGKVFGVQFTMLSTSSTLPVLFAAFGADIIGVTNMLIIIGIPVAFLGLYGLTRRKYN